MPLKTVNKAELPRRSAGKTSLSKQDQADLIALIADGKAASDGQTYDSSKAAAQAAGPYARVARAALKPVEDGKEAGPLTGNPGRIRATTFVTRRDKDDKPTGYGWAVTLEQ